jgi:hypothetical protein
MFNFSAQLQDLRTTIIGLALLLAATILGFVWISIGIYAALLQWLGAIWAPFLLGALCFIPIIIYALVKTFIRPAAPQPVPSAFDSLDPRVHNIANLFNSLSDSSPFVVAIAAVIAGFLASRFPSLLAIFTQVLEAYIQDSKAKHGAARESSAASADEAHTNNH